MKMCLKCAAYCDLMSKELPVDRVCKDRCRLSIASLCFFLSFFFLLFPILEQQGYTIPPTAANDIQSDRVALPDPIWDTS